LGLPMWVMLRYGPNKSIGGCRWQGCFCLMAVSARPGAVNLSLPMKRKR
jgi:hypothetical protein